MRVASKTKQKVLNVEWRRQVNKVAHVRPTTLVSKFQSVRTLLRVETVNGRNTGVGSLSLVVGVENPDITPNYSVSCISRVAFSS